MDGLIVKVVRIPTNVSVTKTIKGQIRKRIYVSKYKSYYYKTSKKLIHYDPSIHGTTLKLNDKIFVKRVKKISARKNYVFFNIVS